MGLLPKEEGQNARLTNSKHDNPPYMGKSFSCLKSPITVVSGMTCSNKDHSLWGKPRFFQILFIMEHVFVLFKWLFYRCLFFFFFLAMPWGIWDLSSPMKDQTCIPLQWKHRILTTRPLGKSLNGLLNDIYTSQKTNCSHSICPRPFLSFFLL